MASQTLLDQFWNMLDGSKSFQRLTPEEQSEIRNSYTDATDQQLLQAIDALKQNAIEVEEHEKKMKEQQAKAVKMAKKLQAELKKIEMDELREKADQEHAKSSKAADELLKDLDTVEEKPEPKPKRKKFLGIF